MKARPCTPTFCIDCSSDDANRPATDDGQGQQSRCVRKAGMTLVEVMIASALLIIGLSGFMTAFVVARRSAAMATSQMEAVHTLRQAIETLSSCMYGDTRLNVGSNKVLAGLAMSNTYTVTQTAMYPSTKDVTVTVYWTVPPKAKVLSLSMASSFTACLH